MSGAQENEMKDNTPQIESTQNYEARKEKALCESGERFCERRGE